jgi:ABC-type lipoprotein release transport system permease subunit
VAPLSDVRLSLRSYARSPGLALALVLTIALGAGANASVYAFLGGLADFQQRVGGAESAARFGRTIALLSAASALVLGLSCASVTGLLLARAASRSRETAVRVALGAGRRTLVSLHLTDIFVVVAVGGAAGALVAFWTASLFPLLFFIEDADLLSMRPDRVRLGVAAAASLAAFLVAGLVPALSANHRDPSVVLRREGPGLSPSLARLRARLVTGQAAGCALLVALAGVIRADLDRSLRTSRGAAIADLTVARVRVDPPIARGRPDLARQYFVDVETQVAALVPGAPRAWVTTVPGARSGESEFTIERAAPRTREVRMDAVMLDPEKLPPWRLRPLAGRAFMRGDRVGACPVAMVSASAAAELFAGDPVGVTIEEPGRAPMEIIGVLPDDPDADVARPSVYFHASQVSLTAPVRDALFYTTPAGLRGPGGVLSAVGASPSYFDLLDDPVVAGRAFTDDDGEDACAVAVISREGADALFGGDAAIGSAVLDRFGRRIEIVGIVNAAPLGIAERDWAPWLLRPVAQYYAPVATLVLETPAIYPGLRRQIDGAIASVPNGAAMMPAMSLREQLLQTSLAPERIASAIIGVCALLALALSLAGIQGAMSDYVGRRRRELAVRLAMGARPVNLVAEVARHGVRLAMRGTVVGLFLAVIVAALAGAGPPPVSAGAVMTALGTLAAIAVLVAAACAMPAWRAIAIDPKTLLQAE